MSRRRPAPGRCPLLLHLNGRLVAEEEARVSVFDRGFLFGDAVFESMRAYGGRVFRMGRHLERLAESARLIALTGLPSADRISADVTSLLEANHLRDARVRLTVTRGPGRPGEYAGVDGSPTCVISAAPFAGLEARRYVEGVVLTIASRRAVPAEALDPSIKSTSRLASVLTRREAQARGAFEAILLDAAGDLTEGTASNLFLVRDRRLATPASSRSALPGVTRAAVLEVAAEAGMQAAEERLPARALFDSAEVFLTNSSWEVLPVVRIDDREVGDGRPGALTAELLRRYRALVALECGCG
jgi:branched-chain amino acid aminotransferase